MGIASRGAPFQSRLSACRPWWSAWRVRPHPRPRKFHQCHRSHPACEDYLGIRIPSHPSCLDRQLARVDPIVDDQLGFIFYPVPESFYLLCSSVARRWFMSPSRFQAVTLSILGMWPCYRGRACLRSERKHGLHCGIGCDEGYKFAINNFHFICVLWNKFCIQLVCNSLGVLGCGGWSQLIVSCMTMTPWRHIIKLGLSMLQLLDI